MTGKIKLKKLSGITVNNDVIDISNQSNFQNKVNQLTANQKIVFAGQDYKGVFTNGENSSHKRGILELELERPENQFKIEGITINKNGTHTYTGKDIEIILSHSPADLISVTEKDSGWFTTQLNLKDIPYNKGSSLKFGEWNDYDLPNKSYVEITFD